MWLLFGYDTLNYLKIIVLIVIENSHISYIIGNYYDTTWGILKYKFNLTTKSTVFNNYSTSLKN